MLSWREDRQEAWDRWLCDFLISEITDRMLGHRDHTEPVEVPSREVLQALVDVGIVLGYTDWVEGDLGPTLTHMKTLVDAIADGIITTYTNEMEQP